MKVSCTVLRGEGGSNLSDLPDPSSAGEKNQIQQLPLSLPSFIVVRVNSLRFMYIDGKDLHMVLANFIQLDS